MELEHAAGNPNHHRASARPKVKSPDIKRETVLARADQLCKSLGNPWWVRYLRRLWPKCERIARSAPGLNRLWGSQSVRAEGRRGVGHALKRGHTIAKAASQFATTGFYNRVHVRISRSGTRITDSHARVRRLRASPEFQELNAALVAYLSEITEKIIREEVYRETGEAEEIDDPTRIGG